MTELLRAHILHTPRNPFHHSDALESHSDGALVIENGRIAACGHYSTLRGAHPEAPTLDLCGGYLLPGFIDTHIHFPQLRIIGGLGRSLLDWLDHVALPEEARMADLPYSIGVARAFVQSLASHGTTTALVFGAHFAPATAALFEAAEASGIRIAAGQVLSDRHLRPELHQPPEQAYRDSTQLIERFHRRGNLLYAITPRFALSASEAILEVCQALQTEHQGLIFTTHMNENPEEIAEVARLFPWANDYLAVYERYGLNRPAAVLAHNVHPTASELERLASGGSAIAHCPCSNAALGSGFFPLHRHLEAGVLCALGTDVGGGTGFGMLKEGLQAYLLQRLAPQGMLLNAAQLLYLATLAGAEALGLANETGDFLHGKSADFVYLKPPPNTPLAEVLQRDLSPEQTLAAIFTLSGPESIRQVRVGGKIVHDNF